MLCIFEEKNDATNSCQPRGKYFCKSAWATQLATTYLNIPHGGNNLNTVTLYIEIAGCYKSSWVDERDLSPMVQGPTISLPHSLATGIWNLAPKAISGPKSRGTSLGTTLWHHGQRYCALGILLAHAQIFQNRSSYHNGGKMIAHNVKERKSGAVGGLGRFLKLVNKIFSSFLIIYDICCVYEIL